MFMSALEFGTLLAEPLSEISLSASKVSIAVDIVPRASATLCMHWGVLLAPRLLICKYVSARNEDHWECFSQDSHVH